MTASPSHIAFIMDGNGRWAKQNSLSRSRGHKEGAEALKRIIDACLKRNIPYMTTYAFSSENWRRSATEVAHIMNLFEYYLEEAEREMLERGIKLKVIGRQQELPPKLVNRIRRVESLSANGKNLTLQIAFNYGARAELVHATKELAKKVKGGGLDIDDIDEKLFEGFLYTSSVPDPDLLIRTSGERRLSNYLLWQLAYTEFSFIEKHWPDFTPEDLEVVLADYQKRDRRFGKAA